MNPIFLTSWIPKGFAAIAIFPFILLRHKKLKKDKQLILHESIHLKQQVELFLFLFYLWYGLEFIFRWIQYKNFNQAYKNISFEREAYANQHNKNYIKNRKAYAFIKYLKYN